MHVILELYGTKSAVSFRQNFESGSGCYGCGSTISKEKLAITYNFTGKSRLWFATYINLNLNIFYLYKIANCKLLFDRVNRSITVHYALNTVGLDIIFRHKHSISRSIKIGSYLFVNIWLSRGQNISERSNTDQFLYSCSHCTISFTDLSPLQGHV